jgi:hypothetical protein
MKSSINERALELADAGGELLVVKVIEGLDFRGGLARQDGQGGAHEVLRTLGRHRLDRGRPMLAPDHQEVGDKGLAELLAGVLGGGCPTLRRGRLGHGH